MQKNKSPILSRVFKLILLIASVTLITVVLQIIGVPKWITIFIILMLYILVMVIRPIYIIYRSKSLRTIDRYISNNHQKPIFGYAYAMAHGSKEDIEQTLKRIMNTYTQQDMRDIYGANLALFQRNPSTLLAHAKKITGQEYQDYYSGHAYVMNNNFDAASESLAKLHTPWMVHSLKAYAALKRGNQDDYRSEMNQSINSAVGMQRYILHHIMRRHDNGDFT
ncbi:hypothetical protein [Sporosarcina sp. YIM B06819]|uniref:hypothetical protein n=1 Tax=Sporosarcina sp. YIM B06819 TaxID=3081769 RepID=UPI00298C6640|nr:hypothetical protein [Sporosarcina sp. YIM B06819]